MSPQNLFVDVETIPDYELSDAWISRRPRKTEGLPEDATLEDAEALGRAWVDNEMKSMALQPEACKLVGLNVCLGSGDPKSGWVGELSPKGIPYTEEDLLTMFWQWAASSARLIGFNCNRFDLHVIRVRSAILGVAPTMNLFNIKPWEDTVIDLLDRRFKGTPYNQFLSLKALRRLLRFQVPAKYDEVIGNTGGDIEGLFLRFLAGNDLEALRLLKLYGELDAWSTRELARMWSGYYYQRID